MSPAPPKMCVAADAVALRFSAERQLQVLLVERRFDPFKGGWALPGGFVDLEEDLPEAAARELEEETGIQPRVLDQVGAWGTPGRDPRGRTVSAVYLALCLPGQEAAGGDDAARAAWHPAQAPPPLAFDHEQILPAALAHLRVRCERTHLAFGLLEETIVPSSLGDVLGALGALEPMDDAARLLAAARAVRAGREGAFRLEKEVGLLDALHEPLILFPPGT